MARAAIPAGKTGSPKKSVLGDGTIRLLVLWRPDDGSKPQQVTATGSSKAAAERALNARIAKRQQEHSTRIAKRAEELAAAEAEAEAEAQRSQSVSALFAELFAELRFVGKCRPQTLEEYERVARVNILPELGDENVASVDVRRVSTFLADVWRTTPGLYKTVRTLLSQAFALATRVGDITTSPVVKEIPRPQAQSHVPVVAEDDEIQLLRDTLKALIQNPPRRPGPRSRYSDLRDLLDIQLATGMRIGEALALRWEHVSLAGSPPFVTVAGTLVRLKGTGLSIQPFPKTSTSLRSIVLPRWAVDVLKGRRDVHPELVFPSRTGELWADANVRELLRKVRRLAGLPESLVPHTMRRTYGTAVDRAYGLSVASTALRHSGEQVTRKSYVPPVEMGPDVRDALDRLAPKITDSDRTKNEVN